MKPYLYGIATGILLTVGAAIYSGGENLTQLGLRMTAATTAYDFVASPREASAPIYDTRDLLAYEAPKPKKGQRK